MDTDSYGSEARMHEEIRLNRRLTERIPAALCLLYSGMLQGHMVMGDGTMTNLSDRGIGIRGNRLVSPGMELALFIDLPDSEDPICIAQTRVSWISGRRFGVEMLTQTLESQNQLRFYLWNSRIHLKTQK
ncbi:MAG TPA: PilZ domain-containing protein [Nitrospira sp.]|nr:PilZ domain-containing protein [Nitrospira sp.]